MIPLYLEAEARWNLSKRLDVIYQGVPSLDWDEASTEVQNSSMLILEHTREQLKKYLTNTEIN